jgi:2-C-methyl-D-erythritol 4-phosphate cytidylyltransferase
MAKVHLLIPAAGVGKRMGGDGNKLLLPLAGKPLLAHTLAAAVASESVAWIGIISQPYDWEAFETIVAELNANTPIELIVGGATRQESVYNGLQALPADATAVLIHDGARCLATEDLFDRCAAACDKLDGFVAAIPVKDTIKVVDDRLNVTATPDRANLWAAQTPQGFNVAKLKACHDRGKAEGWDVTDDAALFERCALTVGIVPGEETNLKITTPVDLTIATAILAGRSSRSPIVSASSDDRL